MKKRWRWLLSGLLLLIVVAAIGLYVFTQGVRNATISVQRDDPPQVVSFVSDRAGDWDIFTLFPDGELVNLTDDGSGAHDYFVSWSMNADPDKKMNFLANRGNPDETGPAQMDPDGGNIRSLPIFQAIMTTFQQQLFDWDPVWSPDGERLAWISVRDLGLELYVVDADAELSLDNATRLTNNGAVTRDWFAVWSPDGQYLAYSSDEAGDENIYVVDAETGERTQLTDHPAQDTHPMYSLDGSQIAFVSERDTAIATGTLNLYIMDADGGNQRRLTDEMRFDGDPLWSADGRYMMYVSNQTGNWHIYVRDQEQDSVRQITEGDSNNLFPVWRP
jgi:Tol biopolymer transport system component